MCSWLWSRLRDNDIPTMRNGCNCKLATKTCTITKYFRESSTSSQSKQPQRPGNMDSGAMRSNIPPMTQILTCWCKTLPRHRQPPKAISNQWQTPFRTSNKQLRRCSSNSTQYRWQTWCSTNIQYNSNSRYNSSCSNILDADKITVMGAAAGVVETEETSNNKPGDRYSNKPTYSNQTPSSMHSSPTLWGMDWPSKAPTASVRTRNSRALTAATPMTATSSWRASAPAQTITQCDADNHANWIHPGIQRNMQSLQCGWTPKHRPQPDVGTS